VRAHFDRTGRDWLVIRMRRQRGEVIRRIGSGPADGGTAGDRFPRRPLRPLGSGAVTLPLPE